MSVDKIYDNVSGINELYFLCDVNIINIMKRKYAMRQLPIKYYIK